MTVQVLGYQEFKKEETLIHLREKVTGTVGDFLLEFTSWVENSWLTTRALPPHTADGSR